MDYQITQGFPEDQRAQAAELFWHAFRGKLGVLMRPEAKALAFFTATLDPSHAISAVSPDGTLLGLAGYKTATGALSGGSFGDIVRAYGLLGAIWRTPFLALLERGLAPDTLLMDGIFVSESARGQGIGTALLEAIKSEARARTLPHVRLDVIDTNPRARALFERRGFTATRTSHIGPLRHLFGFRSATTMTWTAP